MVGEASQWVEVRTAHVRLRAQLDLPAALEAAHSIEATRAAVLAYWGPAVAPKDRLELWVVRDRSSLADFVAQLSSGPTIVTSQVGLHDPQFAKAIAHQIAHHVSAYIMPRQPRWLSEGLAEYLESCCFNPARWISNLAAPPPRPSSTLPSPTRSGQ